MGHQTCTLCAIYAAIDATETVKGNGTGEPRTLTSSVSE
jgi:hypothetical protein